MSFDPMAAAVDWLDAYRAGEIDTILEMYADDAVIECGCGGMKIITGRDALKAYWTTRLSRYPAYLLNDIRPSDGRIAISYETTLGIVGATMKFNRAGRILRFSCGPQNELRT